MMMEDRKFMSGIFGVIEENYTFSFIFIVSIFI